MVFFLFLIENELLFIGRPELLEKLKGRYYNGGNEEKTSAYYIDNKEVLKENAKNKYRISRNRRTESRKKRSASRIWKK